VCRGVCKFQVAPLIWQFTNDNFRHHIVRQKEIYHCLLFNSSAGIPQKGVARLLRKTWSQNLYCGQSARVTSVVLLIVSVLLCLTFSVTGSILSHSYCVLCQARHAEGAGGFSTARTILAAEVHKAGGKGFNSKEYSSGSMFPDSQAAFTGRPQRGGGELRAINNHDALDFLNWEESLFTGPALEAAMSVLCRGKKQAF